MDAVRILEDEIREVVLPLTGLKGPLLPMLHAIQEVWGHVPQAAVPVRGSAPSTKGSCPEVWTWEPVRTAGT